MPHPAALAMRGEPSRNSNLCSDPASAPFGSRGNGVREYRNVCTDRGRRLAGPSAERLQKRPVHDGQRARCQRLAEGCRAGPVRRRGRRFFDRPASRWPLDRWRRTTRRCRQPGPGAKPVAWGWPRRQASSTSTTNSRSRSRSILASPFRTAAKAPSATAFATATSRWQRPFRVPGTCASTVFGLGLFGVVGCCRARVSA